MKKSRTFKPERSSLIDDTFLSGNGEIVTLIRSLDWSATSFGPIKDWPQSLRTTVNLCLASNFPICIVWGPEHMQIYNEGYSVICGEKHPLSMGMSYPKCWEAAWPAIGKSFDNAINGVTSFLENQRMFLFRNGYLEETFFTFSLSPIRDETGGIGGLFHPVTETTTTMVGKRRTAALLDLTARLGNAEITSEVFQLTIKTLGSFKLDLPFVLLYKLDKEARLYRLAGFTGVENDSLLNPAVLLLDPSSMWPMEHLLHHTAPAQISGIRARMGATPCGPYKEAPDVAFAVSIRHPGVDLPVALIMAGASSRLPLDEAYRGFYDLLAAVFRAALGRATVAEEERKHQEMLAALDRSKTVFFSNISHEFRTPLTLMLGPLKDMQANEGLPVALQENLQIAIRNAKRLLKLVNSLLDFSCNEAGRTHARFVATDLSALTIDLVSNFRSACLQAGLALSVDCPPLREQVYVDREMWEKIVLNLLSNAFKFTLQGRIKVSLHGLGDHIELEVADSGVGISAEELPRIFDRFYRVENQAGRSMEGSGIGLSLVQELVQLHGGMISAESALGQGTVFKLSMPFGSAHLPAEQVHVNSGASVNVGHAEAYVEEALRWLPANRMAMTAAQRAEEALVPMQDRPRIVLADDNADMCVYIERILEQGGYDVEVAENGAAALAAIKRGKLPELVLTDVMMPVMDGFSLLQALRADDTTQGIVVILLSARAGEEARLEGLAAGADDYLIKPFGARELRARIDGAITLARQRREAAEREHRLLTEIETERGRAALRESQAHTASLFEQTTAGIAELDLAGRILQVNDRYCQIIGRTHEQLVGQPFDALVSAEDKEENLVLFNRMVETGQPFEKDNRYQHPDGSVVWVSKAVTPIRINGGATLTSVMAVALDITERKKAEQTIQDANQRKDEFLAMLAHELRNPLAPISSAAHLLTLPAATPSMMRQASAIINRQVIHMTELVDDLLDVSRVTQGLVELQIETMDIKLVVASALEQAQPLIVARGHNLVLHLCSAPAFVAGDKTRLIQVLSNLLNNAAKYTPQKGEIMLTLEVQGGQVHLSVSDNGSGMAPGLVPHVFELFTQAQRTPDRAQGGLGLGLSLVKHIIALHGGAVGARSEGLGKGSTFTVTLPLVQPKADSPGDPQLIEQAAPSGRLQRQLQFMIVDDNRDSGQILATLLEAMGHQALVHECAHSALADARLPDTEVFILDIGMPEMDGYELARQLRANPATQHAVLVALTGYGQAHDRALAKSAGFNYFFAKPMDKVELTELLAKLDAQCDLASAAC